MRPVQDEFDGKLLVTSFRDITARKIAEERTSALSAIVDSSTDAIFRQGLDGIIESWNAGAERVYGFSAAEMLGSHHAAIVPEDHLMEAEQILLAAANGTSVDNLLTVRRRKDGTPTPRRRHDLTGVRLHRHDRGRLRGRRRRHRADRDPRRARAVGGALPRARAAFVRRRLRARRRRCHHLRQSGRQPLRLRPRRPHRHRQPRPHPPRRRRPPPRHRVRRPSRASAPQPSSGASGRPTARGAGCRRCSPTCRTNPRSRGWVANIRDITDRREAEAERVEAEERYRQGFERSAFGLGVLDLEQTFTSVNPALAEMLGQTPDALLGRRPLEFLHPTESESARNGIARLLSGDQEFYKREHRMIRHDGSHRRGAHRHDARPRRRRRTRTTSSCRCATSPTASEPRRRSRTRRCTTT